VIALLVAAVATPVNAGYLVIRVILEGGGGAGGGNTVGSAGGPGYGSGAMAPRPPGGLGGLGGIAPRPPRRGMGGGATRIGGVKGKHGKSLKSKTDSKLLYDALTSALEAGMIDEAVNYADELLTFAQDKKDLPGEVAVFAQAYKGMQKALKAPSTQPSPAEDWR